MLDRMVFFVCQLQVEDSSGGVRAQIAPELVLVLSHHPGDGEEARFALADHILKRLPGASLDAGQQKTGL